MNIMKLLTTRVNKHQSLFDTPTEKGIFLYNLDFMLSTKMITIQQYDTILQKGITYFKDQGL